VAPFADFSGIFERLRQSLRGRVLLQEPMSRHTSWRVGGEADAYLVPLDRDDLLTALRILDENRVPWLVIGAGSNLLVRDGGIRGAVIDTSGLNRLEFLPAGRVRAEAGMALGVLVEAAVRQGLAGLEDLYGIPGNLGGALAMNAGVPGHEIGDVVETVLVAEGAALKVWERPDLAFTYRGSALTPGRIAVEARLRLRPAEPQALQRALRERLERRRSSQNVEGSNAGSVFRNPPGAKAWELIEQAGLKGAAIGGARVSKVHANFIVNLGQARAAEILALMEKVQQEVERCSGIRLEPEVKIVGQDE
jgi:UDP-N-acetylmuramate dehydrogenase